MIYLNLGRREQGKTTLALYLIAKAKAIVVFDPRGLCPTLGAHARARSIAAIEMQFDVIIRARAGSIVVTPDYDVQACFDQVCREVKAFTEENPAVSLGFVVDEARFMDLRASADFDWLLRCVGRANTTIVITAHRPIDIPTDIRAIADVWCIFRMTQKRDLDAIDDLAGPTVMGQVMRLEDRHFVSWDDTRARATVHRDPASWHMPLHRAGLVAPVSSVSDLAGDELPSSSDFDKPKLF